MPSTIITSGTAASRAPDPSSGGGHSAPVLEFLCLFTHDLRRKQKRWQDGRLKYHTFNKRVMVYDDRGNFIGDMHWRREWELDDGEEIELERGGVIVQVSECVGRQNQDLSELLDKRVKEKELRQARVALRSPISVASARSPLPPQDHFQTRHRPLHQVLGTPAGRPGRAAVPTESPYELRQKASDASDNQAGTRSSKRRKYDNTPPSKMGYAQSLFGATLTLSAVPMSSAPRRLAVPASRPTHESAVPEVIPSGEGPGMSANSGALTDSSRPGLTVPPPRSHVGSDRHATPDRQEEHQQRTSGPDHDNNAIPTRQADAPAPEGATGLCSMPKDPARPTIPPKRAERKSVAQRSRNSVEQFQDEVDNRTEIAGRLPTEMPRSKVIVVDDDTDDRLDEADSSTRPPDSASKDRVISTAVKQMSAKRSIAKKPPAQKPVMEPNSIEELAENAGAPPREERTELRLKPRQKRGLLLLSERKDTPKQPKRQRTAARGPSLADHPGAHSVDTASSEPAVPPAAGGSGSKNRDASSLSLSPGVPESPTPDLTPPSAQSPRGQSLHPPDATEFGRETGCSQPVAVSTSLDKSETTAVDSPEPRLLCGSTDGAEALALDPSPAPQSRGEAAEREQNARRTTDRDLEGLSSDLRPDTRKPSAAKQARKINKNDEDLSSNLPPDTRRPRSARLARKTNKGDEGLNHSEGEPHGAESDDDGTEELPQVPVGPRLARLGRKSVKSLEVIGYVPSSSPATKVEETSWAQTRPPSCAGSFTIQSASAVRVGGPAKSPAKLDGESTLPLVAQRAAGTAQGVVPLDAFTPGPGPALQRHNSLPDDRISKPREEGGATCRTPCLGDASSRRGLARHKSAVLPVERDKENDTSVLPSLTGLQNTARLEKGTTIDATRPCITSEVIITESTDLQPQLHKPRNPPEQDERPTADGNDVAGARSLVAAATKQSSAGSASRPRIANPATRGRKAALKSDAAGQVPQPVLPTESVPARSNVGLPATIRPDPATANERPKRTMRFPGFVSARGGGPWSREAHDLLETGRPS